MVPPVETLRDLSMLRLLPFPVLALAAVPAALVAPAPPGDAGPWLVLAPPWRDAAALVIAAGGREVGPATAPLGLFAAADAPGFPHRAAALGLLVLDVRALPDFCGVTR
jgi:hypothetical protein